MSQTPAGWYPSEGQERYWDGTGWTDQTRPLSPGATTPPPGQATYAPPPKKKHTVRNVLLILVVLGVLFVGGCVALLAAGGKAVNDAIEEEEKNDVPTAIDEGAAFKHDGFAVAGGWTIEAGEFGGVEINGMRVTLEDDQDTTSGRSAWWTIGLYDGKTIVAEITCDSNEIQEGETSKMDCYSSDSDVKPGDWDTVKVSDFF